MRTRPPLAGLAEAAERCKAQGTADVYIAVNVLAGDEPEQHRGQLKARASELGWDHPHSGAVYYSTPPAVALEWAVRTEAVAPVMAALRAEFDVCDGRVIAELIS